MSNPNEPETLKRVCAVCQQVPCYCPDLADECDDQAAEEEARYVVALLRDENPRGLVEGTDLGSFWNDAAEEGVDGE